MTRKELERKYEERGCTDYQLHSLADLEAIHGVNLSELPGYLELSDEHRELFDKTIIRFFNVWGLDNRKGLQLRCVHYVREVEYVKDVSEDENMPVGIEIHIIDSENGMQKRRLHRYVLEKGIPFKECKKYTKKYLRFELKNEWYHITSTGEWY